MNFSKGSGGNKLVFPLTQYQVDNLTPCGLHSPKVGKPHGLDKSMIIQNSEELLEVVSMVNRGEYPYEFLAKYYPREWGELPKYALGADYSLPQPLINEGLSHEDPKGLANVVHMDSPLDMPTAVLKWLISEGVQCKQSRDNCVDFLEVIPETLRKLAEAVERNLDKAFEAKYYFGAPRPEEVLGVNITSYPEGCPPHATFPAGHGAAASAVSVLISRFDVNAKQVEVIRQTAYLWSQFRSLAGVHYPEDNLAGLKMGGLL